MEASCFAPRSLQAPSAFLQVADYFGIGERGGVAEGAAFGDIAQKSTHDFSAACFGQLLRERYVLRTREFAKPFPDEIA